MRDRVTVEGEENSASLIERSGKFFGYIFFFWDFGEKPEKVHSVWKEIFFIFWNMRAL